MKIRFIKYLYVIRKKYNENYIGFTNYEEI